MTLEKPSMVIRTSILAFESLALSKGGFENPVVLSAIKELTVICQAYHTRPIAVSRNYKNECHPLDTHNTTLQVEFRCFPPLKMHNFLMQVSFIDVTELNHVRLDKKTEIANA